MELILPQNPNFIAKIKQFTNVFSKTKVYFFLSASGHIHYFFSIAFQNNRLLAEKKKVE
jgi:hypothetical protein